MPQMTDPYVALLSFQRAVEEGAIHLQLSKRDPELSIHVDEPSNGVTRMSYAYIKDGVVQALAMVVHSGFENGEPCFDIGYAVREDRRGKGWGMKVATAAIDDFAQGMVRAGVTSLYLEAVVGIDNVASQRIAACCISSSPKEITDSVSGLPALHYSMHVGD